MSTTEPFPRHAELLELAESKGVFARLNPAARRHGQAFIELYAKASTRPLIGQFRHASDAIRFLRGGQ